MYINGLVAQLVERGAYTLSMLMARQSRGFDTRLDQFFVYKASLYTKKAQKRNQLS